MDGFFLGGVLLQAWSIQVGCRHWRGCFCGCWYVEGGVCAEYLHS